VQWPFSGIKFQNNYRYETRSPSEQLLRDGLAIFRARDLYISGPLSSRVAKVLGRVGKHYKVFYDGDLTAARHWIHVEYASPKTESRVGKIDPDDSMYFGNVVMENIKHPGILAIAVCQRPVGEDPMKIPNKSEVEENILNVKSQTLRCRIRGRFIAFYEEGGTCIAAATWKNLNKESR
jgi:hypothetical protein